MQIYGELVLFGPRRAGTLGVRSRPRVALIEAIAGVVPMAIAQQRQTTKLSMKPH
jgi:hypothetical protein